MPRSTTPQERSDAWIDAISNAGALAATAREEDQFAAPMAHLQSLKDYLEKKRTRWYQVPKHMPPPAVVHTAAATSSFASSANDPQKAGTSDVNFLGPTPAQVVAASATTPSSSSVSQNIIKNRNQNRFSAFEDDDDEESSDSDNNNSNNVEEGEFSNEDNNNSDDDNNNLLMMTNGTPLMTMRRLLIRVLTTLSELHARLTKIRRRDHRENHWVQEADEYAVAFDCLNAALAIADEEFIRLFLQQEDEQQQQQQQQNSDNKSPTPPPLLMLQLADDAQVVMIALAFFGDERDKYLAAAQRRRDYLQQKLTPQWEARDEVKERLGQERWENNPRPKNDYARQRLEDERELRALEDTLDRLEAMDTSDAYSRSQTIFQTATRETTAAAVNNTTATTSSITNRYNGIRPDYGNARVSHQDYPDATSYGWIFTGSHQESFVEFFERTVPAGDDHNHHDNTNPQEEVLVKMDFFYTTGTVKTSMDHPTKGPTQLFGNKVTPDQYVQILQNPRVHTNVRYRTKQGKFNHQQQRYSNNDGRGSRGRAGRGRGRGNGFGRGGGSRGRRQEV